MALHLLCALAHLDPGGESLCVPYNWVCTTLIIYIEKKRASGGSLGESKRINIHCPPLLLMQNHMQLKEPANKERLSDTTMN